MSMVSRFLDESIEKSMDYSPKSFEGYKLSKFHPSYLQEMSRNSAYNPSQHHLYLPCGFPRRFSTPVERLWVVIQNRPHVNLKQGPVTLSTDENPRILKCHGLMPFMWTCPSSGLWSKFECQINYKTMNLWVAYYFKAYMLGWMGGTLVCNKPLSSSTDANKFEHNYCLHTKKLL
jgi:hypothetical protein